MLLLLIAMLAGRGLLLLLQLSPSPLLPLVKAKRRWRLSLLQLLLPLLLLPVSDIDPKQPGAVARRSTGGRAPSEA